MKLFFYQSILTFLLTCSSLHSLDTKSGLKSTKTSREINAISLDMFTRPSRGWNAWFAYDIHLDEVGMRSNADSLVRLGLSSLGFQFLNLDGGWQGGRDSNGNIYENATKFPSGLKALSSYVHSLGLLFGSYTDRGSRTCDNHVGSGGFYQQDANSWASWPSDYVKVDSCGGVMSHSGAIAQFGAIQDAINLTNRPMVYSLCGWLKWYPQLASIANVGNSWRIGPDALSWDNVLMNFDAAADAWPYVGPGKYADIDEIMGPSRGRPISYEQTLTQVAMIAVIGSPMLLSFDLTNLTVNDPDVTPFLNEEMLDIHWDTLPHGPVFRKFVGGYVSSDRWSPYTDLQCNASDPNVQWRFLPTSDNTTGYLSSVGFSGTCLYAGAAWTGECNNAQAVWVAECGSNLCCNENCTSMQVKLNNDGTITTIYGVPNNNAPGPYLTLDINPNTLFWEERYNGTNGDPNRQLWSFNKETGMLSSIATGLCLGAKPSDDMNVWGRALFDGSTAFVFANFNQNNDKNITCDSTCFIDAGYNMTTTFIVRDIWAKTDIGIATVNEGYTVLVTRNGASRFLKFTPQ